jgi:hypothetical protein
MRVRKQLLDCLKETRRYGKLKAESSHSLENSFWKKLQPVFNTDEVVMSILSSAYL